ncbi:MAG TPA: hypothetical protein VFC90_09230 [Planctomycetota bacterium]|nr:hypothetical protein [Planctomycetota bacterium]
MTRAMMLIAALLAAVRQEEPMKAPELEGGVGWLNTDKPVTMASLKGKIVLLDFWTYC